MNMRQKYIAFISAFICSSIIMAVAGGLILGFQRPQKESAQTTLYTAPPPKDGYCFLGLESDGQLLGYFGIYLKYEAKKAYLTWVPADLPLPDSALFTFVDIGAFSRLVDNCNGAIYNENSKSHVIMGKDIMEAVLGRQESKAAAFAAAFFGKIVRDEYIDAFEQHLADCLNERGNISVVHWLQRKEAIKNISSAIDISHQTFATLLYKE